MEVEFNDQYLADLYQGIKPTGKPAHQPNIVKAFVKGVAKLRAASRKEDLFQIHSLNFKALSGTKKGRYSVRVQDQYRIEFSMERENAGTKIIIHELSNHYK